MNLSSYPHLVKEWHPTKNGELKPENYTRGSNKKIWWLCTKGHSYESRIVDRVRTMVRCPYCLGRKTLNYDLFK